MLSVVTCHWFRKLFTAASSRPRLFAFPVSPVSAVILIDRGVCRVCTFATFSKFVKLVKGERAVGRDRRAALPPCEGHVTERTRSVLVKWWIERESARMLLFRSLLYFSCCVRRAAPQAHWCCCSLILNSFQGMLYSLHLFRTSPIVTMSRVFFLLTMNACCVVVPKCGEHVYSIAQDV